MRKHYWGFREEESKESRKVATESYLSSCNEFVQFTDKEGRRSCAEWAASIDPWNRIVEFSRSLFGESWQNDILATTAAGIRSVEEKCNERYDLHDKTKALCRRVRYARLRAGNYQWWQSQLESAKNPVERLFASLVFFFWASSTTILKLKDLAQEVLSELTPNQWRALVNAIQAGQHYAHTRSFAALSMHELPCELSDRLCLILGLRIKPAAALEMYRKFLINYSSNDPLILTFCQEHALKLARSTPDYWPKALLLFEKAYSTGLTSEDYYWAHREEPQSDTLPPEVATQIAAQPQRYPRFLVYVAEGRCQLEVETKLPSVADTAQTEGWFTPTFGRP
jgi:hypothetical protein